MSRLPSNIDPGLLQLVQGLELGLYVEPREVQPCGLSSESAEATSVSTPGSWRAWLPAGKSWFHAPSVREVFSVRSRETETTFERGQDGTLRPYTSSATADQRLEDLSILLRGSNPGPLELVIETPVGCFELPIDEEGRFRLDIHRDQEGADLRVRTRGQVLASGDLLLEEYEYRSACYDGRTGYRRIESQELAEPGRAPLVLRTTDGRPLRRP